MNITGVSEPQVTLDLALEHGLTKEEYDRILQILGRTPTYTELGIYSVMWSEHCSYKNSIAVLKTLPRTGRRLLVGAGEENAGLVDIGDGFAVAFKVESHNHPSAVEPYQGAATGVGGIMRDVFTMGARPIAGLNSLRFGRLKHSRSKYRMKNVVRGIGDYGNSFGVPTVGGEIYFDDCYQDNPLVNAMAVGIVRHGETAKAIASGPGNPVMIVGSSTGRDGIHGATFASEEISEESESRRPSVQVGDPFTEKLLLEATLEAIASGFVVGIQDMGAAGLTCSSTEMSAKGRVGMDLYIEKVPAREAGMSAYEIMLSESQERMLLVVEKGHEEDVRKIFSKWDLPAVVIGYVKANDRVTVYQDGEIKADVPADSLVLGGGAPVYTREAREAAYVKVVRAFDPTSLSIPEDFSAVLCNLIGSPTIGSKRWAFEQYDSMVRTNTVATIGDAALVRIKGTKKALSLTIDCNGRYVYLNPRRGGEIAVAEAARNIVCTGAQPIAITNCLNFGNPYDPEVYWQFKEAVAGIGNACRVLNTPVTGGNVSFYNESEALAIFPTPVIGMVGLLEDVAFRIGPGFRTPGDQIVLLGWNRGDIGGSEYLYQQTEKILGDAPFIDLEEERRLHEVCLRLMREGLVISAHDISEGGIAVALAESCFMADFKYAGAELAKGVFGSIRPDFWLFGESQSSIVATCPQESLPDVYSISGSLSVPVRLLGRVTDAGLLRIGSEIAMEVSRLWGLYETAIDRGMED
ncbi:MAG: phosphoribosylformylglycinamidine synthase subunit PurL [Ignavibacteriales bacterium]|nr:phosphoribosylformylglycinamidine synthase subunit PurL [Ignavibacteriales bacterium]